MAKKKTAALLCCPWPWQKSGRLRGSAKFIGARGRSTRRPRASGLRAYQAVAQAGFEFAQVRADQSEIGMEPLRVFHAALPHFGRDGVFHVMPNL